MLLLPLTLAIVPVFSSLEDLANCDPLKKDAHCPPDPAFAGKASFDFTTATWNDIATFWSVDADTAQDHGHLIFHRDGDSVRGGGAAVSVWAEGQAPTLTSNQYLLFGRVSVELLAAQGPGLITAMVLKSDSGDEIDWELLGAYENQAQSNYFYNGQALFNTYNTTHPLDESSFSTYHKYSIDWSPTSLTFLIDDLPRGTWLPGQIPAEKWPQTPMQVKIGLWSVSDTSDPGEISWAGGLPDWTQRFAASFRAVHIEDHVGGCNRTEGGVEYIYNERTRGWRDIHVAGCVDHGRKPGRNGSEEAGPSQGEEDEGGARRVSSPLAAVLLLAWVLIV